MTRGFFGALADMAPSRKDGGMTLLDLPDFLTWGDTKSGQVVNHSTALRVMTVLACCKVIAEGIAGVPLKLFRSRKGGQGSDPATDLSLYMLLYRRPNSWQTAFEFWETIIFHLALCANAFVFINRVGGRIFELIIIEPGKVTVRQNRDFSLTYTVTGMDGAQRTFSQGDIWHLRGPSWNGWMGMETVRLAREAIGLTMALEVTQADQQRNGSQSSGVYTVADTLTEPQHEQMVKWIKAHSAGNNKFNPLILDRSAQWLQQGMTGVDSQHLETRGLQIEEIWRAFRVMPIMVGHSDKTATYASAEQMFLAHVVHTITPWAVRIEQSIDVHLIDVRANPDVFARFNLDALMRGSAQARGLFYTMLWNIGAINPDEVRDKENWNPIPDGKGQSYFVPLNAAPLPDPGADPAPKPAPTPPAKP